VSDLDGDTFRGVYTLKFRRAIYVKVDVDLITQRVKAARIDHEPRYGKTSS